MTESDQHIEHVLHVIRETFEQRGKQNYGIEEVTQLQHALQSAALAESASESPQQISAALLHDIGHIMHADVLPGDIDTNLHDHHEERAYEWIKSHFGNAVADPVRLHVAAKRYLCTVDASYAEKLTPTSYKSFLDQGGEMSEEEKQAFEAEPFYNEAVSLRRWDDRAKDKTQETPSLQHFEVYLQKALADHYSQ